MMKTLLFVLLILLTWYMAAMYHQVSLMTLAATEFLLLLCMFLISRYLKCHLRAGFPEQFIVLQKQQKNPCQILIENTGFLPSGRLKLRFRLSYWDFPGAERVSVYGNAGINAGKSAGRKSGSGQKALADFYITAPWCGMMNIAIKRVRVFDYFSLFKARIGAGGKMNAAVLPVGMEMKIRLSYEFSRHLGFYEKVRPAAGNGSDEIRQLREYSAGDSYRLIHWKQTARTDEILVKEQEPEQEQTVFLYLNFHSEKRKNIRRLDAFFEVLCSLTMALLRESLSVHILWKDRDGLSVEAVVNNEEDCQGMLLRLYREDSLLHDSTVNFTEKDTPLCLSLDLALFSNGREVFRFLPEKYESQIGQMVFIL